MYIFNRCKGFVLCGAVFAASGASSAYAGDTATFTITQTVVVPTCTPEWTTGNTMEVPLGTVSGVGNKGQDNIANKTFTLSMKDCTSVNKVKVTASGTPDTQDAKAFKNTATDTAASGVAVYLLGGPDTNTRLDPDGSTSAEYSVTDSAVSMDFKAVLEGTGGDISAGAVEVPVTLNMTYE